MTTNPFLELSEKLDALATKVDQLNNNLAGKTQNDWITTDKTAELLGVNRATLWHWRKKNILTPARFGNTLRYRLSDIEDLAAQSKQ